MAIKVELFGVTYSDNKENINVFFKTPKRFIYQLMFMKHSEYVSVPKHIDLSEDKRYIFTGTTAFSHTYMRHTNKYDVRAFKYNTKKYPHDSFNDFCKKNIVQNYKIIELYEFLFSETYEYLINENNITYVSLTGLTKELYKWLKKYRI